MPEIAARRSLTELIRTQLVEAGFDWRAVELDVEPRTWARPPFSTDLEVGGHPLQPHLAVRVPLDLEGMVEAYEHFLGGYVFGTSLRAVNSVVWLGNALGLSAYAARQVFVPMAPADAKSRPDLVLNAAQFAALVAQNFESHTHDNDTDYVVTAGSFVFGVERRQIQSNLHGRGPAKARLFKNLGDIRVLARGAPAPAAPEPSQYDVCHAWLDLNKDRLNQWGRVDAHTPLSLALRILWWRNAGRLPSRLKTLLLEGAGDAALHGACTEARGFVTFDSPLRGLYQIYVPQFLSRREFTELFGNTFAYEPKTLGPRLIGKWEAAIEELDPGPQ